MGRKTRVKDFISHRKGWRITREESFLAKTILKLKNLCLKKQKEAEKEKQRASTSWADDGATSCCSSAPKLGKIKGIYHSMVECCFPPGGRSFGRKTWKTRVEVVDIRPEKQYRTVGTQYEIQSQLVVPDPSSRKNKSVRFSNDLRTRYYIPSPPPHRCESEDSLAKFIDPEYLDDEYDDWGVQNEANCPWLRKIKAFWVPLDIEEDTNYICQAIPAPLRIYAVRRRYQMQQRKKALEEEKNKNIVREYECQLLMNRMIYQLESEEYGFGGVLSRDIVPKIDAKRRELMALATEPKPEKPKDD
ncbi:uncharacterized protein LOC120346646 isoform X2 [Styela clava]